MNAIEEIDEKNNEILASMMSSSEQASSSIDASIDQLKTAIKEYQSSLKDYVSLSAEKAKILAKWSKAGNGQSYTLPGVFSDSIGITNANEMKADNERLNEITPLATKAQQQNNAYFKMVSRYVNEIIKQSRVLSKSSEDIDSYLLQLSNFADWNQ